MSFASLNPLSLLFPTLLANGLFAPVDDGPANGSVGLTPCQTGRADQVAGANRSASRPAAIVTPGLGRRCGSSCPIMSVAVTTMERLTMMGVSHLLQDESADSSHTCTKAVINSVPGSSHLRQSMRW